MGRLEHHGTGMRRAAFTVVFNASAAAFGLLFAAEFASAVLSRAIGSLDPATLAGLIITGLGVYLTVALPVALLAGSVLALLVGSAGPAGLLFPARLRELPADRAANWLSLFAASLPVVVGLAVAHRFVTDHFVTGYKNLEVAGRFLNLAEYALAAVGIALVALLVRPARTVLARLLPARLFAGALGLLALTGAGGGYAGILWLVRAASDRLPGSDRTAVLFASALPGLVGVLIWFFSAGAVRRPSRRWAAVPLLIAASTLLLATATVVWSGRQPQTLTSIKNGLPLLRALLARAHAASDFDHDGYSSLFNGSDCHPFDRRLNPAARELPGNGQDENCLLGDPAAAPPLPDWNDGFVPLEGRMPDDFNIVLVSIDALRKDRLHFHGYQRQTSPVFDRLAAGGAAFENFYSTGTGTILTLPAMTMGRHLSLIGLARRSTEPSQRMIVHPEEGLAAYLKRKGFVTGAVFPHEYNNQIRHGFDFWWNGFKGRFAQDNKTAATLNEHAGEFLDKHGGRRFFLWVHYYDPHDAYLKHDPPAYFGKSASDRYDGEIRYTDSHVGDLLERIENRGSSRPTLVIFTADHGECLGEHGITFHNNEPYRCASNIPLVFHLPGTIRPGRYLTPGDSTDLLPTLRNLLGDLPDPAHTGRSLAGPLLLGREDLARAVYQEAQYVQFGQYASIRGITTIDRRFIWNLVEGSEELYDAVGDPKEKTNLIATDPAGADRMRELLRSWMEHMAVRMPVENQNRWPVAGVW